MPKHYRKRKRKRRKKNQISSVRIPGIIMPDTAYVKLRFSNSYLRVVSGTTVDQLTFVGNGLFDPDLTLSSGQFGGYSQWMSFFDKYEIVGSRMSIQLVNLASRPFYCTLSPKNISSTSGINSSIEQRYTKRRTIGNIANANAQKSISSYMNTKKLIGRHVSSVNFTGTLTSNPFHQWYWQVTCESVEPLPAAGIPAIHYDIRVVITMDVKFSQRQFAID